MNNDIHVTAEGHVHVGHNVWVSLEQIEQAVLAKQSGNNPGLSFKTVPGEGRKPAPSTNQEEHLPLPSTLIRNDSQQSHDAACDCEHLPLPSTLRIIR